MTHYPHKSTLPAFGASRNPRACYGCATVERNQWETQRSEGGARRAAFVFVFVLAIAAILGVCAWIG